MKTASELKELIAMLENGYITRAQFDAERDKLLGNSTGGSNPGVGKSLGAYNILGMVGSGGMGVVYRARHRSEQIAARQGGDVALKVLHAQYSQNPTFQERFEREATLGLKLNHDGVVKVFDLIVAEGDRLALAMELVSGTMLSDLVGKVRGPIPWREALAMFDGLLDAVSHAHSQGVVHRDLKPENVMVCEGGGLKVLDFGIARDESSGKTQAGMGMGTIDYMAPEQYTDASKVDARADIYALGMTMYEMVAGRLPWEPDATEFEVKNAKANGNIPPPTKFYRDIPPELVLVIDKALHVDVKRRHKSAKAFRKALKIVIRSVDAAAKKARAEEARKASKAAAAMKAREEAARKASKAAAAMKAREEAAQKAREEAAAKKAARRSASTDSKSDVNSKASSQRPNRRWKWLGLVIIGFIGLSFYFNDVAEDKRQAEAEQQAQKKAKRKARAEEKARLDKEMEDQAYHVEWLENYKMVFVPIPADTYRMGCTSGQSECSENEDEEPPHDVKLTSGFSIMTTEVTQGQYEEIIGDNPSEYVDDCGSDCPVQRVSWYDAVNFANELSIKFKLPRCYDINGDDVKLINGLACEGYRLPTEAEWEVAARGGEDTLYAGGDKVKSVGWYKDNSHKRPHPVGQKDANGYGLYDMSGNVSEWVWDWYDTDHYQSEMEDDPMGPQLGTERGLRGGTWRFQERSSRVSSRSQRDPNEPTNFIGFRLVQSTP